MMINNKNITDYIDFLYQQKFSEPAPKDLIESWTGFSNEEITHHLQGLYQHWELSEEEAKDFENRFLNRHHVAPKTPIIPAAPKTFKNPVVDNSTQHSTPNYDVYPDDLEKKKNTGVYVLLLILLLAGSGFGYFWMMNKKDNLPPAEVVETNRANENIEAPKPASTVVEPEPLPETEDDRINGRVIMNLFAAEESRDFEEIYNCFDNNMERYWDINYPTYYELIDQYELTWKRTAENRNENIKIEKVAEKTYNVSTTYKYFQISSQSYKTVQSTVRFVFNDDHLIVKVYGL